MVSRQQQHGSHVLCEGLELVQEMIHENNDAPAEGIAEGKIAEFEARYDAIVRTATEEYADAPHPSIAGMGITFTNL